MLTWLSRLRPSRRVRAADYERSATNINPSRLDTSRQISQNHVALIIALLSALFTGYQAWSAHNANELTKKAQDGADAQAKQTLQLMAQQTGLMRAQAEASVALSATSNQSIKLSERSIEEQRKLSNEDRRPWIGVVAASLEWETIGYYPDWVPHLTIENFGKTPAMKIKVTSVEISASSDLRTYSRSKLAAQGKSQNVFDLLMPGRSPEFRALTYSEDDCPIPMSIVEPCSSFILGIVRYEDVFHNSHHTDFCEQAPITFVPDGQEKLPIKMRTCSKSSIQLN